MADGRKVCYSPHSHETFSIGLIDQGGSNYINGSTCSRIEAGTLVLMNPGDVHACNPIGDQVWSYRMVYVDVQWLANLQNELGMGGAGLRSFSHVLTHDPQLQSGFRVFYTALTDSSTDTLQKRGASIEFFALLHERLGLAVAESVGSEKMRRAAEFISEHFQRPLRLDEISHEAGVSPSSLIRCFKKAYGMTPHAYLTNRRVQFARAQLRRGLPIVEVAMAAGFADQAHLQRTFKQLLAATPGHYRGVP